jgi:hypothetical protein
MKDSMEVFTRQMIAKYKRKPYNKVQYGYECLPGAKILSNGEIWVYH